MTKARAYLIVAAFILLYAVASEARVPGAPTIPDTAMPAAPITVEED